MRAVHRERRTSCGWPVLALGILLGSMALAAGTVASSDMSAPLHPLPPQSGTPALRNFSPKEYGAGQQNFALVQDRRGIVYAGNADGVLEFDGARWRLITTSRRTAVRSLAVDASGRVWVGAQGEIGYLAPDSSGATAFVALNDRIPEANRNFQDVWGTFAAADGMYFATYAALFRLRDDNVDVWIPETSFRLAFLAGDRLFVRQVDRALVELRNDRLEPVFGAEILANERIYTMAPWDGASILIGTASSGLFVLDGATVRPLVTEVDEELKKALVFKAMWLADGRLALGTLTGGVMLFDRQLRFLGRVTKETGLQDQNVKGMMQDAEGGLWLALNNGIARVEITSALTAFGERSGLAGAVICERSFGGTLYVGTTAGLFRLTSLAGGERAFSAVSGVVSETWDLAPFGDALLVANATGVYSVRADRATLIRPSGIYASALLPSRSDPRRVFIGLQDGLATIRQEGQTWFDEGALAEIKEEVRALYEARDGSLWAGTTDDGVLRVTMAADRSVSPAVERFGTAHGLPTPKHVRIYDLAGEPLFATENGIYRFDDRTGRFEPDQRFAALFGDAPRWVMAVRADASGRLWMHSVDEERGLREAGAAVEAPDGSYHWVPAPPLPITATDSDLSACVDEAGIVWFGSPADGLLRYDPGLRRPTGWPYPVLVRRAIAEGDRTIEDKASLEYSSNSLRFEFAAPAYDAIDANRYQVLLEGNDRDWSPWSAETFKEYTNLPEGSYRFRVRARNVYGDVSPEAVFGFLVLTPWYRTWIAYVLYIAAATALVYLVARVRTRALVRRTVELEERVAKRTAELAESRQEALEANRAKSEFLANMSHELRTPLNAVIGFAQLMRRNRGIPVEERDNLEIIAQSGEHLLGLINDVLSLSKIEAGRLTLDEKAFHLVRMLEAVEAMTRVRSEAKGLELAVEIAPGIPEVVSGDEGKLRQVLLNLLGNAVKFTNTGRIVLRADWSGGRARFEVEDTGEGIAEAELGGLFEPFVQTETGRKAKEGTGLGLVISRQIVRLMGGDITVRSTVGRGTTFAFDSVLPATDSAVVAGPERRITGLAAGQRVPRILVVDDTRDSRVLLSKLLAQVGFEVREAANGQEAVDAWRTWRPDMIWMDMRMPVMDGRDATREIRRLESGARTTRILALTASAFEHEAGEILACGADDFVTKPFREQTLFAKLAEYLGVRYTYEDAKADGESVKDADGDALTVGRLGALPRELVVAFGQALSIGSVREAQSVADRIGEHDPELGRALVSELKAYNMDELIALVEQTGPAE